MFWIYSLSPIFSCYCPSTPLHTTVRLLILFHPIFLPTLSPVWVDELVWGMGPVLLYDQHTGVLSLRKLILHIPAAKNASFSTSHWASCLPCLLHGTILSGWRLHVYSSYHNCSASSLLALQSPAYCMLLITSHSKNHSAASPVKIPESREIVVS